MKKLFGLLVFVPVFFALKSFGGYYPPVDTSGSSINYPLSIRGDTIKKTSVADSTKKDTSKADTDDDNKRSYAIGLTYGSNQSYLGLQSNIKLPYVEPNFTYSAPSGFYAEASVQDVLIKKKGGFDQLNLNPGWNIDLADNTTLNFNLSHYIFRANTPLLISSDLSDVAETYIDKWIGETEGKFTISYNYYKKSSAVRTPGDIVFTPDLAHTFEITINKKSSLSFVPEATMAFGTRNGFTHYEVNNGDTVLTKRGNEKQIPDNSTFGTLDYSLVFNINYTIGNFEIEPAINYIGLLYKPPGVPAIPLTYFTIALIYTIY